MKLDCILSPSSLVQLCFQWRKGFYFPVQYWILHVLCHLFWQDQALCLQLRGRQTLPDLGEIPLFFLMGTILLFKGLILTKNPPLQNGQHLYSSFYPTEPLMNFYLKRNHGTDQHMPPLILLSGLPIILAYSDDLFPRVLAVGDKIKISSPYSISDSSLKRQRGKSLLKRDSLHHLSAIDRRTEDVRKC